MVDHHSELSRLTPRSHRTERHPMTQPELRPLARTIIRLDNEGMPVGEIAWRFRRSPGHISRILEWSELPRTAQQSPEAEQLRPIERRVLQARSEGVDRSETAARIRRSPEHVARIERYADLKLSAST